MKKSITLSTAVILSTAMLLSACGQTASTSSSNQVSKDSGSSTSTSSSSSVSASSSAASTSQAKSNENVELTVVLGEQTDFVVGLQDMLAKKFPNYTFNFKTWDTNIEQTVKTAFAADKAIDVVAYWPTYMNKFKGTGIPMDLTKYMDADPEWKNSFADGALEVGKTDEGLLDIPTDSNYPLFQYNADICKAAGVEMKDRMTWDEFMDACKKIKAYGKAPLSLEGEWACWAVRNGLMQCWNNEDELKSFIAGQIPFTDDRVKKVFDNIASLYTNDYVYPKGIEAVNGGPAHASEVPSTLMISMLFSRNRYGLGSAIAVFIIIECFVFSYIIDRIFKERD